jgi:hypothetical protein
MSYMLNEAFRAPERNIDDVENLHALAELLGLTIERHDRIGSTPTIVVKNEKGEDVHIGFPEGYTPGVLKKPMTTGKMEGVKLQAIGDGPWLYEVDI